MDKLLFATAGIPNRTNPRTYKQAISDLKEMNLGALEIEFVHGVKMNEDGQKDIIATNDIVFTAHGPYYINLNAKEEEKVEASITRILDTARMLHHLGGYSIVFHAAFYLGQEKELVYPNVKKGFEIITDTLNKENIDIWVRPELTGKATQWGDLDELIKISNDFEHVLPCIDFSHFHARTNGKFNTYDEFANILERMGNEIGSYALENFHGHVAGIAYGEKGEKNHLNMIDADFNYRDLMKALKDFNVKGVLVCESPNIEEDAMMLQSYYNSL